MGTIRLPFLNQESPLRIQVHPPLLALPDIGRMSQDLTSAVILTKRRSISFRCSSNFWAFSVNSICNFIFASNALRTDSSLEILEILGASIIWIVGKEFKARDDSKTAWVASNLLWSSSRWGHSRTTVRWRTLQRNESVSHSSFAQTHSTLISLQPAKTIQPWNIWN